MMMGNDHPIRICISNPHTYKHNNSTSPQQTNKQTNKCKENNTITEHTTKTHTTKQKVPKESQVSLVSLEKAPASLNSPLVSTQKSL